MKQGRKVLAAFLAVVMVITMMGCFDAAKETNVRADENTYYAGNPIITSMFTADPSAHVWEEGGRIYIYASHDIFPSRGCDLMDKYHVFSSDNMVTWRDEGEILSSDDVSWGRPEGGFMWAPDAAYENGTYYFYFPHPTGSGDDWNNTWRIGLATSSSPASGFTCADDGYVKKQDGTPYVTGIDPCVFKDDDGTYYLYTGGGSTCYVAKLQKDMQTLAEEPVLISNTLDDFHEGMWVFKKDGIYYAMYADNTAGQNLMRYSTASSPYGPWKSGGVILDATGCDTTHGSIAEYKGHWYLFYHNCEISGNGTLRSVCIDEVHFNSDGSIQKVQQTKQGVAAVDYVNPDEIGAASSSPDPSKFTEKTDYSVSSAEIGGGATRGNGVVENLHYEGSYVEWSNVNGGKGGQAMLTVYYGTPDGATSLVNSSGDTAGDGYFLKFDKTTGWGDHTGVATCFIDLNAGTNNTVKLTCGMGGVNITGMSISLPDQNAQETEKPTEAPTEKPTEKPTETPTQPQEPEEYQVTMEGLAWKNAQGSTELKEGDNVTFSALLYNNSSVNIPAGQAVGFKAVVDGSATVSGIYTGGLKAGETVKVSTSTTWAAAYGGHTVVATVNDTDSTITKSFNVGKKEVTFPQSTGGYDLVVTNLEYDKASIAAGDRVLFTATVTNIGDQDAPSNGQPLGVRIHFDGNESVLVWNDQHLTGLKAGESVKLTMTGGTNNDIYWTATAGTHTATAWVNDQTSRYPNEVNFNNNQTNFTITVPSPAMIENPDEPDDLDNIVIVPPVKESRIRIDGYQISTTLGGFRTVYSVSDPSEQVESLGLVYGLTDYITESDMVVGSSTNKVFDYAATEIGKMGMSIAGDDYESYAMTMQFDKQQVKFLSDKISVRAYAKLKDGTYIYSSIQTTSIYDVADYLYQNRRMNTFDSHNYLYNNILTVVTPDYKEVDYNWNDVVVTPDDI